MNKLLDIQATIECGFSMKRLRDMIRTYNMVIPNSLVCKKQPMVENIYIIMTLKVGSIKNA